MQYIASKWRGLCYFCSSSGHGNLQKVFKIAFRNVGCIIGGIVIFHGHLVLWSSPVPIDSTFIVISSVKYLRNGWDERVSVVLGGLSGFPCENRCGLITLLSINWCPAVFLTFLNGDSLSRVIELFNQLILFEICFFLGLCLFSIEGFSSLLGRHLFQGLRGDYENCDKTEKGDELHYRINEFEGQSTYNMFDFFVEIIGYSVCHDHQWFQDIYGRECIYGKPHFLQSIYAREYHDLLLNVQGIE